jgi:hypothetical protein
MQAPPAQIHLNRSSEWWNVIVYPNKRDVEGTSKCPFQLRSCWPIENLANWSDTQHVEHEHYGWPEEESPEARGVLSFGINFFWLFHGRGLGPQFASADGLHANQSSAVRAGWAGDVGSGHGGGAPWADRGREGGEPFRSHRRRFDPSRGPWAKSKTRFDAQTKRR